MEFKDVPYYMLYDVLLKYRNDAVNAKVYGNNLLEHDADVYDITVLHGIEKEELSEYLKQLKGDVSTLIGMVETAQESKLEWEAIKEGYLANHDISDLRAYKSMMAKADDSFACAEALQPVAIDRYNHRKENMPHFVINATPQEPPKVQ